MAEVILFHHALGITEGVRRFAEFLEDAGHRVHLPDLYDGRTFGDIPSGVAHAEAVGFEELQAVAEAAVRELPDRVVYAGFSLGSVAAQRLTQIRPGAAGALLFHGGEPVEAFGAPWPAGVPLQVHVSEGDEWVERDVVERLCAEVPDAELFVYPGAAHLFLDDSFSEYDAESAELVLSRALAFLDRI